MGYRSPVRGFFAAGLSQPASPHPEIIKETEMSVGLLIVDIQNDYFAGGKWELDGSETAGIVAGQLLKFFREHKLPVVHIQHVAGKDAPFFVPGTPGVEIRPVVRPL